MYMVKQPVISGDERHLSGTGKSEKDTPVCVERGVAGISK
jgi:hypothetical protein